MGDRRRNHGAEINIPEGKPCGLRNNGKRKEVIDDVRCSVEFFDGALERLLGFRVEAITKKRHFGVRLDYGKGSTKLVRDVPNKLLLGGEGVSCGSERELRHEVAKDRGDDKNNAPHDHQMP